MVEVKGQHGRYCRTKLSASLNTACSSEKAREPDLPDHTSWKAVGGAWDEEVGEGAPLRWNTSSSPWENVPCRREGGEEGGR